MPNNPNNNWLTTAIAFISIVITLIAALLFTTTDTLIANQSLPTPTLTPSATLTPSPPPTIRPTNTPT
ncbi:MAG TPA: hypothetical protein VLL52_16440, partial [Anaerolineae bacterium]|nr:hypothetical protein [Anaerolineae bacterium]